MGFICRPKVTVLNNGISVGSEEILNLIPGTNITLTFTDNTANNRIDATITYVSQISRIQSALGSTVSGTSAAVTFNQAPTNGNTLIMGIMSVGSTVSTVTSTSATWTSIATNTYSDNRRVEFWIASNVQSAGSTVTVTMNASTTFAVGIMEYQNLVVTSPFDVSAFNRTASGTTVASGTTTITTQAPELWLAMFFQDTSGSGGAASGLFSSPTNNFSLFQASVFTTKQSVALCDFIAGSTGTASCTVTNSTGDTPFYGAIVAVK